MIRLSTRLGLCLAFVMAASGAGVLAQNPNPATRRGTQGEAASTSAEEQSVPVPPETSSVTKHDWSAGGRAVHYTATAGNLLIRDEKDKANGSIFYVAYTEDGADAKTRPVTFFITEGRDRRRSGCTWDRWGRCGW